MKIHEPVLSVMTKINPLDLHQRLSIKWFHDQMTSSQIKEAVHERSGMGGWDEGGAEPEKDY